MLSASEVAGLLNQLYLKKKKKKKKNLRINLIFGMVIYVYFWLVVIKRALSQSDLRTLKLAI